MSAKLIPAALTAIRTSPGPTGGSGRSWTCSTSGGTVLGDDDRAHRARPYPVERPAAQRSTARPAQKPSSSRMLLDRRSGGTGASVVSAITAWSPAGLGADGGGDDVHAVLAEDRADPADHARLVVVAEDREVLGERHVEALAPDPDQVGNVARADRRCPRPRPSRRPTRSGP